MMTNQQKQHASAEQSQHQRNQLLNGWIESWQDDKGFGFIHTENGDSYFFHISEYKPSKRPDLGEQVVFVKGKDNQSRLQAKQVQYQGHAKNPSSRAKKRTHRHNQRAKKQAEFEAGQKKHLFLAVGLYVVLAILAGFGGLPWWVVGWYVAIGVVTFIAYAKDKWSAKNGSWRTPESTLHMLAIMGGWGGALIAQAYLRHKSKKPEFRTVFYVTVLLNLAGLVYVLLSGSVPI